MDCAHIAGRTILPSGASPVHRRARGTRSASGGACAVDPSSAHIAARAGTVVRAIRTRGAIRPVCAASAIRAVGPYGAPVPAGARVVVCRASRTVSAVGALGAPRPVIIHARACVPACAAIPVSAATAVRALQPVRAPLIRSTVILYRRTDTVLCAVAGHRAGTSRAGARSARALTGARVLARAIVVPGAAVVHGA